MNTDPMTIDEVLRRLDAFSARLDQIEAKLDPDTITGTVSGRILAAIERE